MGQFPSAHARGPESGFRVWGSHTLDITRLSNVPPSNSLKGVRQGTISGSSIGVSKGDSRSLDDYGSYSPKKVLLLSFGIELGDETWCSVI